MFADECVSDDRRMSAAFRYLLEEVYRPFYFENT